MTVEGRQESEGDRRDADVGLFDAFSSARTTPWPTIPHYYGTVVRQLLLGGAALMLLASPLYGSNLRLEFPVIVLGALLAAGFGALITPHSKAAAYAAAAISGAAVVIYATWGISGYLDVGAVAFVLRLAVALVFLFAFYFSMKTVRAFALHQVGRRDEPDEFETEAEKAEDERYEGEKHRPEQ
ncbi:MAG: hypothetical protein RLZZ416_393 [Candidatus Parcubacteria bacterium]|jgi:hypothetical protein